MLIVVLPNGSLLIVDPFLFKLSEEIENLVRVNMLYVSTH